MKIATLAPPSTTAPGDSAHEPRTSIVDAARFSVPASTSTLSATTTYVDSRSVAPASLTNRLPNVPPATTLCVPDTAVKATVEPVSVVVP